MRTTEKTNWFRGNESGSVLIWVMVVGLFAVGALGAVTRLIPAGTQLVHQDSNTTYALIGAESGVHYVAHRLRDRGGTLDELLAGTWAPPPGSGVSFEAASDGEYVYLIATYGEEPNQATRRLRAKVVRKPAPEKGSIDLKAAVFAATERSTSKNPAFFMKGGPKVVGIAGTNASVQDAFYIDWSGEVTGEILVGPGGGEHTVFRPAEMDFRTPIQALPEAREFPLAVFPEPFPRSPSFGSVTVDWRHTGNQPDRQPFIIDGSGYYDTITVESGGILIFDTSRGDLRVRVKTFTVQGNGHVRVQGDGKLFLFVDQAFRPKDKTFHLGGDPTKATVYYAGTEPLSLGSGFTFSGIIHVKNANVTIEGSFALHGSLFSGGQSVVIKGGSDTGVGNGVVYAPNAYVQISGGAVTGAVVGNRISMTGGSVAHAEIDLGRIPVDFETEEGDSEEGEQYDSLEWHVCWDQCEPQR